MKCTNFTFLALSCSIFIGCSNSENKGNHSEDSDQVKIAVDTGITKNNNSTKLDPADITFLKNAAIASTNSIEISNKIIQLGASKDILTFADKLLKDNTTAITRLTDLAKAKGYQLPKTLPLEKTEIIKKLETFKEDGKNEFFVQTIIDDYQRTIDRYTQASKSKDFDIEVFAKTTKPTLESHYTSIKEIEKKIIEAKSGQGDDPLKKSDQSKNKG